jgi:hypothetical protein
MTALLCHYSASSRGGHAILSGSCTTRIWVWTSNSTDAQTPASILLQVVPWVVDSFPYFMGKPPRQPGCGMLDTFSAQLSDNDAAGMHSLMMPLVAPPYDCPAGAPPVPLSRPLMTALLVHLPCRCPHSLMTALLVHLLCRCPPLMTALLVHLPCRCRTPYTAALVHLPCRCPAPL